MVSSKGKPTDPKLREEVKEKVKNQTNKDGGGKGQWSAWKVSTITPYHFTSCCVASRRVLFTTSKAAARVRQYEGIY